MSLPPDTPPIAIWPTPASWPGMPPDAVHYFRGTFYLVQLFYAAGAGDRVLEARQELALDLDRPHQQQCCSRRHRQTGATSPTATSTRSKMRVVLMTGR